MTSYRTLHKFYSTPDSNSNFPISPHITPQSHLKHQTHGDHKLALASSLYYTPIPTYPKNTTRTSHISITCIPPGTPPICSAPRHSLSHYNKSHPNNHPYTTPTSHTTHQLSSTTKIISTYHLRQPTHTKDQHPTNHSKHQPQPLSHHCANLNSNLTTNLHSSLNPKRHITCSLSQIPLEPYIESSNYHYLTIQTSQLPIGYIVSLLWTYIITSRSHTLTPLSLSQSHSNYPHSTYLFLKLHPTLLNTHNHLPPMCPLLTSLIINLCNMHYITHFPIFYMYSLLPTPLSIWMIIIFPLSTFHLLAPTHPLLSHTIFFGTFNYNTCKQNIFTYNLKTKHNLPHKHHFPTYFYQTSYQHPHHHRILTPLPHQLPPITLLIEDIQTNLGPSIPILNFPPNDPIHYPQINHTYPRQFQPQLLLLQCGDIHPNPGPMPDILKTHPTTHKRRQLMYFIPSTIKFQPEYQHLAHTFAPIFQNLHPLHAHIITSFPHLYRYTQLLTSHPPPRIIYALIVTISPSVHTCNTTLQQEPITDWTLQLLEVMATLPNPPERHIATIHPYTQFRNNYIDIITPSNTVHKQLYNYIHLNPQTINIHNLSTAFPYLPKQLLLEALRYNEPLLEYTHPTPLPTQHLLPPTGQLPLTSRETYAIT